MTETRELSGFELIEKLGEGGMASVWKARQVSLDRQVAIKFLSSKMATDPDDVQRFKTEAQSAAKLKHPGIVQVYDASFESGVYSFVMEYVAGYTVGDWLLRKGHLSQDDIIQVADCVADALGYAWEKERIIHCDIKPDNVMVDSDGTVKVMDLGLARTISNIAGEGISEEVLGTPAYMAPEQAMGDTGLDFRADIYALGAMMYHLSTGQIPFQGEPEQSVMEKQITGTLKNPYDINPSLSKWFCQLIEVMMAKDKVNRYESWDEVRTDFARVKRGLPPHRHPVDNAASTVAKSERLMEEQVRMRGKHGISTEAVAASASGKFPWILVGVLVAMAVIIGAVLMVISPPGQSVPPPPPPPRPAPDSSQAGTSKPENLEEQFQQIKDWSARNMNKPDEAIERFRTLAGKCPGTDIALKAQTEIEAIKVSARNRAIKLVIANLKSQIDRMVAADKYEEAIQAVDKYSGEWSAETREERTRIAESLRQKLVALTAEKQRIADLAAAEKCKELLAKTVNLLLSSGVEAAYEAVDREISANSLGGRADEIRGLSKVLLDAVKVDQTILDSFNNDKDNEITIQFLNGPPRKMKIISVDGETITAGQTLAMGSSSASTKIQFSLKEISVAERLARMGSDDQQYVALIKGLMAYNVRNIPVAKKFFEKTHPLIAGPLIQALGEMVPQKAVAPVNTETAAPRDVAAAVEPGKWDEPGDVAAHFLKKNREMDPGEIEISRRDDGKVIGIEIHSSKLIDLSPVTAFLGLRSLVCASDSGGEPAPLSDISMLAGLPVENLILVNCKVSSFQIVKNLPNLKSLTLAAVELKDVAFLRGLQLQSLNLSGTKIYDFTPLSGMPLKSLYLNDTQVKTTVFMQNMPLEHLELEGTPMYEFTFLAGLPLKDVNLSRTQIRSLDSLKSLSLKNLSLAQTKVVDISQLSGMPTLDRLDLAGTMVKDFRPIKGLKLRHLDLRKTSFEDVSLLADMPFNHLNLRDTKVKSLQGLNLTGVRYLDISNTLITDLSPLKGTPITWLACRGCNIDNLAALANSKIRYIYIDRPALRQKLLGQLPEIREINGVNPKIGTPPE